MPSKICKWQPLLSFIHYHLLDIITEHNRQVAHRSILPTLQQQIIKLYNYKDIDLIIKKYKILTTHKRSLKFDMLNPLITSRWRQWYHKNVSHFENEQVNCPQTQMPTPMTMSTPSPVPSPVPSPDEPSEQTHNNSLQIMMTQTFHRTIP